MGQTWLELDERIEAVAREADWLFAELREGQRQYYELLCEMNELLCEMNELRAEYHEGSARMRGACDEAWKTLRSDFRESDLSEVRAGPVGRKNHGRPGRASTS